MRIFLGGTCNGSTWRDELISKLKDVDYFNPIVKSWDDKAKEREEYEKAICDYNLFVITPKMKGVFSIAEAVDCSNKIPDKTLLCFLKTDGDDEFDEHELNSLSEVAKLCMKNGGRYFINLDTIATFLNHKVNKN